MQVLVCSFGTLLRLLVITKLQAELVLTCRLFSSRCCGIVRLTSHQSGVDKVLSSN
jgi:hypothetical protein